MYFEDETVVRNFDVVDAIEVEHGFEERAVLPFAPECVGVDIHHLRGDMCTP